MSFSIGHMIADLAFFVAPAIVVTLTEAEKTDLLSLENMLARRKTELKLYEGKRAFAARVSAVNKDIVQIENMIADYRHIAKVRR